MLDADAALIAGELELARSLLQDSGDVPIQNELERQSAEERLAELWQQLGELESAAANAR